MFRTPITGPSGASCPICTIDAFWVDSEKRWVRLRITNAALRLIDKLGIDAILVDLRARGEI